MDWAKAYREMWERLWDYLIYPIIKIFDEELYNELKADRTPVEF